MEQHTKTIRWGIIGLGNIAHKFAQDLMMVEGCELYAVASRSQEKADEFASQYKVSKSYNNYEVLANDSNIDAVYIATPHVLHNENTILCLNKGIAVLCEKPFAMDSKEVEEMIACAKANNVLLMEALWTYFLPHYQFALELIQKKTYGNVLNLYADFGFFRPFNNYSRLFRKSLGGGSLLDIGIYPIFAALSILGKPNTIEADATFYENGADSSCDMIFEYSNNIRATLKSSLLKDLNTEAIIECEKATIKLNRMFHKPTTVSIISDGKEDIKEFGYQTLGYNYEIMHFNQLIRNSKTESDVMTFKFSKQLIKTLDEVRKIIGLNY